MLRLFSTRAISRNAVAATAATLCPRRWNSEKATDAKEEPKKEEEAEIEAPNAEHNEHLKVQLKDANEKILELKKDHMYALAETDNVRRISKEDVDKARSYGVTSFGKDMLEVTDTLEKAIEAFQKLPKKEYDENKAVQSIYTGVKMSHAVLLKNLSKHGIEKIDIKIGETFDPHRHEALFKAPVTVDCPAEHVAVVVKSGYMIKDRGLRATQVGVAEKMD